MIAAQQIQERRLAELLKRQLGTRILTAIGDPQITEIIVNEDGRVWFESYGKGMQEAGVRLSASQVESLIGTVAASLGTVANSDTPSSKASCPLPASVSRACSLQLHENRVASCASPPRCFIRSTITFATQFSRRPTRRFCAKRSINA